MSLNLIRAKAWKNGREKICRACKWFCESISSDDRHQWDKCSKSGQEDFEKWQGGNCKNFQKKENNE